MAASTKLLVVVTFVLAVALASAVQGDGTLALTIYNDNFGMVKDVRSIQFEQGESQVAFTDVAETIQTETVMFKPSNTSSGIRVYQQNYENNLADRYSLLKKYLDRNISIDVTQGQLSRNFNGKLVSYQNAMILQTSSGISIFESANAVHVDQLSEGLLVRPTLIWRVFSPSATTVDCEVAYRAKGFSWKADYLMTLNQKEDKVDFAGWVTIDNNSGKTYKNTSLKLIAGDVNVIKPPEPMYRAMPMMAMAMNDGAAAAPPAFAEKSFADYHMYTLSQRVNLNESSKKQIEFIPTAYNVSVQKYYTFTVQSGGYGEENIKSQGTIRFVNSKENGMGMALPKGTIRVFKTDQADNSLEFIGEDKINHTPKDENVTVTTGTAFDIVAKKIALKRNDVGNGYDASLRLEVTNRGDIAQQFRIELANNYGDNNEITQKLADRSDTTHMWKRESASKYTLKFKVDGGAKHVVDWQESYRY